MYFLRLSFILLVILSLVKSEDNDTSLEHHRKQRVSGRIVKIYSGAKPDPVVCQREGFQADVNDCSVFYRCLKGNNDKFTVFRFQCAPGTVYDIEKEVCNYPYSAKRSDCRILSIPSQEKHDNEVTNIRDELPKPIKTTQSPNNYISSYKPLPFEYSNELPDHQDLSPYPNLGHKQDSYSPPSPIVVPQINPVTQEPNVRPQSHQGGDPCVANGFMGDSSNCKKFYRCVSNLRGGFIRYEFLCTDATIWDDSTQSCNHAWLARNTRCGRNNKYTENIGDNFGNKDNKQDYRETSTMNNLMPQNSYGQFENINQPQQENNIHTLPQNQHPNDLQENNYVNAPDSQAKFSTQKPDVGYLPGELNYGDKIPQYGSNSPSQPYVPQIEKQPTKNKNYNHNCFKDGFFGYRDNCNKFYRCVENNRGAFTRYEFSCSEGTVWDDNLKACNFAWAVKECGGRISSDNKNSTSTEFPHYATSSLPTYIDTDNNGYNPQNIQSENQIKEEMVQSSSPATTKSTTISNNNIDKDYDYGYPQNSNDDTVNQPETNNINEVPIKSEGNKCTKSGFMGDDNNCNKFYRCVDSGKGGFIQYEFSCGEGTVWDSKIESCNHAWAVEKCGQNGGTNNNIYETPNNITTTSSYKPASPTTTTLTTVYSTLQNTGFTQPTYANYVSSSTNTPSVVSEGNVDKLSQDNNCKGDGFYPNSEDCKKFYRCVSDGSGGYDKVEFTCGEGTAWDVSINSCNHIEYVKSCSGSKPNQINEISEDTVSKRPIVNDNQVSETNDITTSTTSTTTTQKPKPSMEATKPTATGSTCSQEGYFGDQGDCKKFHRCVDDGKGGFIKYEFSCGDGTIWDSDITACNHPSDVKNPSCSLNNAETATSSSLEPSSTSSSIQTTGMIPETSSVSSSSTAKQDISEQITSTTSGSIQPNESGKQNCNKEGFFGNTEDCKSFYRCVNDGKDGFIKYEFTCGEGTIWDQDILACNHPGDVKSPSCSSDSTEVSKTTKADLTTSTTERVSTTTMLSTTSSTQTMSTEYSTIKSTSTITQQTSTTQQIAKETTTSSPAVSSTTTMTSTEYVKPSKGGCTEEGYFGNPDDCTKFYRCVYNGKDGYVKYDFTCGEGTVWDQDITTCNHPRDVVNLSCSSENADSSVTTSKEYPSSSESTTGSDKPPLSSSNSPASTEDYTGTTENNVDKETPAQQEKGNFTCEKAGFYPNPYDCKKFYRCVDWNNDGSSFSIFHFECGEGTIWDPSLDTCNYEDSVYPPRNCNGTASQAESSTESSTTQSTSTSVATESTTSTEQTKTTSQQTTTNKQPTTDSTTTEQQTSTTEKSTTQSTTPQDTTTMTTTTTTQQSTTATEQTTQTDKATEESTSEGTTQPASTEQQSTSTTEQQSTSTTEQQSTSTTEQQSTSESTTESDKTTTESSQQTTESSSSNDKCPEMNEDQNAYVCPTSFRRHPKYCNLFYQCTEDDNSHDLKIAVFHCPNDTIYDESKTQCVNESKSDKKCEGTKAQTQRIKRFTADYVEPMTVDSKSHACPGSGYFPFESNQDCSPAFLKCQRSKSDKFRGYVYKCPQGYTFWTISKRCERMTRVKDCKRSSYPWDKRHDIPTEIRNVAP